MEDGYSTFDGFNDALILPGQIGSKIGAMSLAHAKQITVFLPPPCAGSAIRIQWRKDDVRFRTQEIESDDTVCLYRYLVVLRTLY